MTDKLKKTIEEELAQLPKEGQNAIASVDWVKIAEEIGKKFLLEESEIEDFQLETLLVLIGVVDLEFYTVNIENHVNTTKEKAETLADEAFQKIFTPIRDILEEDIKKNIQNKNPNLEQTLDFILSGGNYFAFLEEKSNTAAPDMAKPIGTSSTLDMKDKLIN